MNEKFWARVAEKTGRSVEDILTDKKVWAAIVGLLLVLNQWLGWTVPVEVFAAAEALIVSLIVAWSMP